MAEIKELNAANFDETVKSGGVLVDFWAPWCNQCRLLGGILDLLDHDYQSLFLLGGVLTLFSILLLFKVYRNFLKQGGDAGYRAPMPE